jgi:uncharacterized protein (TIGR02271 family)
MTSRDTAQGRITVDELREIRNAPVYTADGEEFGHVGEIWYDEDTREARYLKVGRGALGLRAVFVPVQGGTVRDDGFQVPFAREQLESSPEFGEDEDWTDEREREFSSYYAGGDVGRERDVDVSDADAAITRSEEEVRVGKRDVEAGQVRLRKYVETEPVEMDVDLKRETARVTREPIDEPASGADFSEKEIEVPLRSEEAVVQKQAVAKERIGIEKDVETERRTISDEVRKERIDVDDDTR